MHKVYERKHQGQVIRVSSENMFKSGMKTKNPKQVWSYSIEGILAGEGYGSKKDAFTSAEKLIERRLLRDSLLLLDI